MKLAIRLFVLLFLIAGGVVLIRLTTDNQELKEEIDQLEAELGRLSIEDKDRVYFVEIEEPDVPPEVASHLVRIWQFRCYLPAGYDFIRFSGGGRVLDEGVYLDGGSSSGWGSPSKEATHQLLTISFQENGDQMVTFSSFGGSSGASTWARFNPERFDEELEVQKIVSTEHGARSFGQDTILPVLRIYNRASAEERDIAGQTKTTYQGGFFVLCPKSRQQEFDKLKRGQTPAEFAPSWIASEATDE